MDSSASLLGGVVFGSIGLGYFIYGKKQDHLIAGIALMGYSYFVTDLYWLLAIGIGLMALPRLIKL
ncbi:hypothetical protein D3879_08455 [Pseudomonas cavernicola]|uniref:Uncharacterized protein n=1 Tax=Pseudomonas cavernicola TaxID=2320866 RepID=A0A418XLE7_9PSED|nr:hypothetical protein [Pseudomonas cavernicola]RJG13280.1 hypothetical protein D3879_08455 [Pseudomonas cavernicola]